jgi:hypothetical protein
LGGLPKEVLVEFDFDQAIGRVENFGGLYKLIDAMPVGFVGKNGKSYSPEELRALVDKEVRSFVSTREIDVSRLSKVSDVLAAKFPELIKQWYKDNAELELDA